MWSEMSSPLLPRRFELSAIRMVFPAPGARRRTHGELTDPPIPHPPLEQRDGARHGSAAHAHAGNKDETSKNSAAEGWR